MVGSRPLLLVILVGTALPLSFCTPTRSTIGGHTASQLDEVAGAARAECLARRPGGDVPPHPFTTDGCSLWPDGAWQGCCVTHDKAYWCGGTAQERREADEALRICVVRHSSATMAGLMYVGVRLGGAPWLPVPWRWGYGWDWPRSYDGPD